MKSSSYISAALALAFVTACGGSSSKEQALADSLARDKTLLAADSTRALADTPTTAAPAAPAPAPVAEAPAPRTRPRPRPSQSEMNREPSGPPVPSAPPMPVARTLGAGTSFEAALASGISSRINKAGEEIEAAVSGDVTDANGRVVIPSGSTVTLRIAELGVSENKGDKTGKLVLSPVRVTIGGKGYALDGTASVASYLKGRKGNIGDAAKVGAGVGIGAIAGKIIGGGKGAVIGGLVGGAVGTQRAIETADRDVIVDPGTPATIRLNSDFTRS